jgi:F0F1-type ATP synthase assembly protein I
MARPWKEIGRYGSVGIELVLTILILAGLGHWLDARYWGARGWGTGVGFILGVAVAFRNLMRTAKGMQHDIERAEAQDPEASRWTVDEDWVHKEEGPSKENGKR